MATSTGAGSGGQHAVGTGVMGGMISATILAIYFVPLFFVLVRRRFPLKPRPENNKRRHANVALFNFRLRTCSAGSCCCTLSQELLTKHSFDKVFPVPSSRSIITTSLIIMGILRKQYTVVKLIYSIAVMTTSGDKPYVNTMVLR